MNARLTTLVAVVIAIAAIVAGCGDSDDSTSSSDSANSSATTGSTAADTTSPSETTTTPPDSNAPVTTSSLSKAAVIKKAAAACQQTRKGLSTEQEAYIEVHIIDGLPQAELLANMTREVLVPRIETEIETIRKTGAPTGDEKQVEAVLTAQQQGVDEVAEAKKIATNKDLEDPFANADQMRRSYGFPVCSYIP
ncbi:MAG: hypothetical protein WA687_06305 [Solirubrobacterales bacterium]